MRMLHINMLKEYYAKQLRKRRGYKLCNIKKKFLSGELYTQVLLRKSYLVSRNINVVSVRRTFLNLRAFVSMPFLMRGTSVFIGMPYHIFSSRVKPLHRRRR